MSEVRVRASLLLEEAASEARDEVVGILRELGLSGYASSVLYALARVSEATAADLVAQTTIPDSKIYYALRELAEAGLVEVQEGRPKTYRMVSADEVGPRLEQLLTSRYERQRSAITRVASLLEPLRSGARSPAMDLAYVVKGLGNVLTRADAMIASAKHEVLLLASEETFIRKLEPELAKAVRRGIRVKLAIPGTPSEEELGRRAEVRTILCACRILVVDGQQILTVSGTERGGTYGITSTDETLVRLGLDYWESPRCCEV
ncbi:MAG: helix-turn-helix domain-containing protein [Thermoplasmata archaeon]